MSADEFQQLWKAYDAKLEKSMKLNHRLMTEIGTKKVHVSFNWQIAFKIMMIALGIAWNVFIGGLLWRFHTEPIFVVCAAIVLCCTAYSIGGYILQLLLLLQIRMSDSILETQKQLAHLEAVIIQTLRVGFLQTPAYCFFFLTRNMIASASIGFWVTEGIIGTLMIGVTIWVYRTVNIGNASKKGWVKQIVDNEGGKSITRARQFIREVKEWEKE
jgi:hypothetical protein